MDPFDHVRLCHPAGPNIIQEWHIHAHPKSFRAFSGCKQPDHRTNWLLDDLLGPSYSLLCSREVLELFDFGSMVS